MKINLHHWRLWLLFFLIFPLTARPTLLLCDSYQDYSQGTMQNQLGGIGFKGYWGAVDWPEGFTPPDNGESQFTIASGALSSGSLTTYANRISLPNPTKACEIKRKLGITLGQNGTTVYLRYLLRCDYTTGSLWPVGSYVGMELRGGSSTLFVGGKKASITIGSATAGDCSSGTTYLLVVKMQFQSGKDVFTLYTNPSASQEPSTGTVVTNVDVGQLSMIAIVGNLPLSADEIVAGDSYASVMNMGGLPTVPTISITDANIVEGNSATNLLTFTAKLSSPVTQPVAVDYKTGNLTAIAGQDYVSTSGTLVFPPGATSASATVSILGDLTVEGNESFLVILSWPVSARFSSGTLIYGTYTILNDDVPRPSVNLSRTNKNLNISWTATNASFVLESAATPNSSSWNLITNIQQTQISSTNYLFQATQVIQSSNLFFRTRKIGP